jgi:uncharacterized protein
MAKDFDAMEDSNRSGNPDIHSVSRPDRRIFLKIGGSLGAFGALSPLLAGCAQTSVRVGGNSNTNSSSAIGFKPIAVDALDRVVVPDGYVAVALAQWGEPIGVVGNMPTFKMDGSNTADEQAVQMGMHHDGLHFYALQNAKRGLLVMNHEYVDDGLLHVGGMKTGQRIKSKNRKMPMVFR